VAFRVALSALGTILGTPDAAQFSLGHDKIPTKLRARTAAETPDCVVCEGWNWHIFMLALQQPGLSLDEVLCLNFPSAQV